MPWASDSEDERKGISARHDESHRVEHRERGFILKSNRAYAKVNLALAVLGKREDGYHDISTLMVPIAIWDQVYLKVGLQGLRVLCPKIPGLREEDNLAYKAVRVFLDFTGEKTQHEIYIEKRIPSGAGMGGGSSNAASVLLLLNNSLPPEKRLNIDDLLSMAKELGSDVPFFLGCNNPRPWWEAALCTGVGDKVKPVESRTRYWLVVVVPSFEVRSGWAYSRWDEVRGESEVFSSQARAFSSQGREDEPQTIDDLLQSFSSGNPESLAQAVFNDLEEVVAGTYEEISLVKRGLISAGALGASMTGSGSAVFGICRSRSHALEVKNEFLRLSRMTLLAGRITNVIVTHSGVMPCGRGDQNGCGGAGRKTQHRETGRDQ